MPWTLCELYNSNNVAVGSFTNAYGQYGFSSLPEGDYYMVFVYGSYTTTKQFHINSHQIHAGITVSTINAYTTEEIDFHANVENATGFEWDFGDGTWIMGVANPTLAYHTPGTYTVTLKCSNSFGCQGTANVDVMVEQAIVAGVEDEQAKEASVIAAGKTIMVNLNGETSKGAELKIHNLLGQNVYNQNLENQITNVGLDSQPSGYYLVSVKNGTQATTRRVYLSK